MNHVILIGNLGQDAEFAVTPSGTSYAKLRLATSETWKDQQGQKKEKTTWHSVTIWGERAKGLAPHLVKGTKLSITGSIVNEEYEKNGEKRYATSIRCDDLEFVGGKGKGQAPSADESGEEDL